MILSRAGDTLAPTPGGPDCTTWEAPRPTSSASGVGEMFMSDPQAPAVGRRLRDRRSSLGQRAHVACRRPSPPAASATLRSAWPLHSPSSQRRCRSSAGLLEDQESALVQCSEKALLRNCAAMHSLSSTVEDARRPQQQQQQLGAAVSRKNGVATHPAAGTVSNREEAAARRPRPNWSPSISARRHRNHNLANHGGGLRNFLGDV